uniref:p10 protein n=1 Tax=Cystovirus phi6 TaxID=10879 RepID=W8JP59_9VIRU|nr:P10 protein [Cystovirus phi6]
MDNILDPLKAPFSSEAAAKTTAAKVAVVYALVGLVGGLLLTK